MKVVEGRADIADLDAFLAALDEIGEATGCVVQAFDARLVVDRDHLRSALAHAERARERGEAVAREPAVEVLLYAAGRRQIDQALEMGVREGEGPVVILVAGGDEAAAADRVAKLVGPAETLGVAADEAAIRAFFGVTDSERAATDAGLAALVRERVALLDVEK